MTPYWFLPTVVQSYPSVAGAMDHHLPCTLVTLSVQGVSLCGPWHLPASLYEFDAVPLFHISPKKRLSFCEGHALVIIYYFIDGMLLWVFFIVAIFLENFGPTYNWQVPDIRRVSSHIENTILWRMHWPTQCKTQDSWAQEMQIAAFGLKIEISQAFSQSLQSPF